MRSIRTGSTVDDTVSQQDRRETVDRLKAEYYSDRLREQGTAVCEWHEGSPAWPDCPECQAAYEADQENLIDAMRHGDD